MLPDLSVFYVVWNRKFSGKLASHRLINIQHTAGGVGEFLEFFQSIGARLADAENVGSHGEQILDLLSLHREGKPDGDGFHQPEPGKFRNGIFFLQLQLRINNGF